MSESILSWSYDFKNTLYTVKKNSDILVKEIQIKGILNDVDKPRIPLLSFMRTQV